MWQPIIYRQFWDVPRLFAVEYQGDVYLLESDFDDQLDDYEINFRVYRLSDMNLETFHWDAPRTNAELVGEIPVTDVKFDATRRKEVDTTCLSGFKPKH